MTLSHLKGLSIAPATKRARSETQKQQRRAIILEGAAEHLADVGFDAFSMSQLARLLGFAKGTLYLYFETREEVLLALFEHTFRAWAVSLKQQLQPDLSDERFSKIFLTTALDQPTLIVLLLRLSAVIEHNVSVNALIHSKRLMRDQISELATPIGEALKLGESQANDLLVSLAPLLIGTAQHNLAPCLARTPLPADVRAFVDSFSTENLFILNACRIIRCIRAENMPVNQPKSPS